MPSKTLKIPLQLIVCTKDPPRGYLCYECKDTLRSPYLLVVNTDSEIFYCKRCAYKEIESQQAKLLFLANDINSLKEFFPKKVKTKTEDINLGEHL